MNTQELHSKALGFARSFLRAEADLVDVLGLIDQRRAYRELGHKSLFEYAMSLGLSESVSYNLILVARKSQQIPALKDELRRENLTLSNARLIAPILSVENQERWISKACLMSKRELEREVVKEFPRMILSDRAKPVREGRMRLEFEISDELYEKFKKTQDLMSSKLKRAATLEETLSAMAELFLEKNDPVEKAKRAKLRPVPGQVFKRRLPMPLKHRVVLRDQGRCTYQDPGNQCKSRRWLDIHHIQPLGEGGRHTLDNLTTLCRGHHQMMHNTS